MQLFLVFVLFIYSSHSWVLKKSHQQVILGDTKNVSLQCQYDNQDNGEQRIVEVLGMIIRKFRGSDQWETYAKIRDTYDMAVLGDGVGAGVWVKGHADTASNSFLSIMWPVAFPNISGLYACEVNGYSKDDELVKIVTDPVSIIGSHLSLESLLATVLDVKEKTEKHSKQSAQMFGHMQELFQTVHDDLENFQNLTQEMMKRFITREEFTSFQNDTQQTNERYITREEIYSILKDWLEQRWPSGQYGLLNTEDGCPDGSTGEWISGYFKIHSESSHGSTNADLVSQPSHLAKPWSEKTGTGNFLYMRTCKHTNNTRSVLAWPKGRYCIHRAEGLCPRDFEVSRLTMDTEDDTGPRVVVENAPDGTSGNFYFCCRRDGDPTTPIYLPVTKPFYLYRNQGRCQEVQGASVTEEWLQIDTEDDSNQDNKNPTTSLDVSLDPVKFSLCYYTKRQ